MATNISCMRKAGEVGALKPSAKGQSHCKRCSKGPPIVVALQQSLRVASTQIHDRSRGTMMLIGEWQLGLEGACASSPGPDHRPGTVDSFSA